MEMIHQPILSDCDEEVNIYVVVNRVLDMPLGLYKEGEYIKHGDFARKAGYLSLEQYSLSMQGALAFFITSKSENYQALYQKAGYHWTETLYRFSLFGYRLLGDWCVL